jgi:TPR repeat protein
MRQAESTLGELAFQAEGGDAGAQYRLGVLFLLGESVEQDIEAASRWVTRAAASQYPGALALAGKLADRHRHETRRQKNPVGFAIRIRTWMRPVIVSLSRFYPHALPSVRVRSISTGRGWKIQAKNLVARVRFQLQTEVPEFPARRREGFQFRDSL